MNDPDSLVRQLLDTVQQRMESKVLERLGTPEGAQQGIGKLLENVEAEEFAELQRLADAAKTSGEDIQAEMYQLIQSDLLPQAVGVLRGRLKQG